MPRAVPRWPPLRRGTRSHRTTRASACSSRRLALARGDQPKPIITVIAGVPLAAIAGGEDDVDHLPRGDEVHSMAAARAGPLGELAEEPSQWRPEHGRLVPRIHPVTMKLDEDPVGPMIDGDAGTAPEPQPVHRR